MTIKNFEPENSQKSENARQFVERMTKHADDLRQAVVSDIEKIIYNLSITGKKARMLEAELAAIHGLCRIRQLVIWYAEHLDSDEIPF